VNSKQVVAVVGLVALLIIIVYPALSIGSTSLLVRSTKINEADHVYVTIGNTWAHRLGRSSSEGWELISNQSQTVDLVTLADSTTALGKGSLSVSQYDMIRIDISNVTWVYNNTSSKLHVETTELPANVEFTVVAGKESVITLVLTGHQEEISGTKFFMAQLNATLTNSS
jgi:hypothetical protein